MMNLAAYTLKPPTSVAAAVVGRFSDEGAGGAGEEVVSIRGGRYLEVARLSLSRKGEGEEEEEEEEEADARLEPLLRQDTFSTLRSICKLRPAGAKKDYVVVGSDSGRLSVLELVRYGGGSDSTAPSSPSSYYRLRCAAWMPLGPVGCRRSVPGQYVAADPRGRAVFTASVDGNKAAAAVLRDAATGRLELRPAQGFAKASGTATVLGVVALDTSAKSKPAFAVLAGRDTDDMRAAAAEEREAAGLELPDDSLKHVTVYEVGTPAAAATTTDGSKAAAATVTVATDAKRWRLPASRTGCGVLAVPAAAVALGGASSEGEGALLVLSENWVGLKHRSAFKELRAPFPRPKGLEPSQGVLPIAWTGLGGGLADGGGGGFVALVQSEWGDLYEVTVATPSAASASSSSPPSLRVRALPDWLPPCTALASLKGGRLLWAAAEAGDHTLQLRAPDETEGGGGKGREALPTKEAGVGDGSREAAKVAPVFERSGAGGGVSLVEVAREGSLAGCLKLCVAGGTGPGRRVAALCGRGAGSRLRALEGGLPVVEELEAPLPFRPTGVWSLAVAGTSTLLLLLSGAGRTAVLEVGEALVEVDAGAKGFEASGRTLEAGVVGGDGGGGKGNGAVGMVQVTPALFRYVVAAGGEKGKGQSPKTAEWRPPGRREIDKAALSPALVAVAVGGVEVAVFDTKALAKAASGAGEEVKPQATRGLGVDISALHVAVLPGQPQQLLVVVGTMDMAVRVLAYEEGKGSSSKAAGAAGAAVLEERFKVTLSHRPESFASLPAFAADAGGGAEGSVKLQLCVGLASGEAQWMGVEVTASSVGGGAAARSALSLRLGRSRSVGAGKPVRLVSLQVGGQPAVLTLAPGSQAPAWLFYPHGLLRGPPLLQEHPLAYPIPLEAAAPLALKALPEAMVAVTSNTAAGAAAGGGSLRILWVEQPLDGLGLTEDAFPHARLAHTPRAIAPLPRSSVVVVAEGDAAASLACPPARETASLASSSAAAAGGGGGGDDEYMEVDDEDGEEEGRGKRKEGEKKGASITATLPAGGLLRVLEAGSGKTRQLLQLEEGLMPVAVAAVRFQCVPPNELFVVAAVVPVQVSSSKPPSPAASGEPAAATGGGGGSNGQQQLLPPPTGYLYTYRCLPNAGLQLAHRTAIDDGPDVGAPRSLCAFGEEWGGRLLVGFGATTRCAPRVRVYELGKRRLLRKCDSGPLAEDPRLARAGGGIVRLEHRGPWVFATDALKGVQVLHYSAQENRLRPVADESIPRLVSDALVMDRTSVAGADRSGSLFLVRLPWEAALAAEGEASGGGGGGGMGGMEEGADPLSRRAFWEACGDAAGGEGLGSFPSKLEAMAEYHVGEVVTSLVKARLGTRGDREALLFATVAGAVGTLCPLGTQREREVLPALEAAILKGEDSSSSSSSSGSAAKRRKTAAATETGVGEEGRLVVEGDDATLFPTGRDHLTYRAGLAGSRPSRGVVDLDLIAAAGPARRARAAKLAKLEVEEAEAVVTEAVAAMALGRRSAVIDRAGGGEAAAAAAAGSTS